MLAILPNKIKGALTVLLHHIFATYLGDGYCTAIFWDDTKYESLLSLPMHSAYTTVLVNQNDSQIYDEVLNVLNMGCQNYIVTLEDPKLFLDAFGRGILFADQRFGQRKIIIIGRGFNLEKNNSVFNHIVFNDLPNVLLIELSDDVTFLLYTTQFNGRYNNSKPVLLDTFYCNETFQHAADLFPDKTSNFEGRALRVATFNYKPYSLWRKVDEGGGAGSDSEGEKSDGKYYIDGTEVRITFEYCNRHNCTIRLVLDEKNEWGEIWDNRSGNGILGALSEGRADIGLGALYTWYHEYQYLDLSVPQVRTGITCLTPTPRLLAGWLTPAYPFNQWMWIAVLASLLISGIGLHAIKLARKENSLIASATWLVGRIYLLQPAQYNPTSPQESQMLAWVLLLGLMLTNAYSGGLSSVMTIPRYEPSIDTVSQFAGSGLEWGATHEAWIFSILSATQPDILKILAMFRAKSEDDLRQRTSTRDFAFSVERLPAGHFAIGDYITGSSLDNLQLMTQDIYWEQCVSMTPKSSPFLKQYDELVLRLHETGLLDTWEYQVVKKHLNYQVQWKMKLPQSHHDNEGPVRLRPDHILGVYFIWGFGLGVSSIVFVVELFIYQCTHK